MGTIAALREWLLDLVFPKQCLGCGQEGLFLCSACRVGLVPSSPSCPVCGRRTSTGILCGPCAGRTSLRRFLAPYSYRDPLARKLIHTYKYGGVRELAGLFSDEIAAFLDSYAIRPVGPGVLVPVPLHPSRERERGFNQAQLLAAGIGERLGVSVADALHRTRATEPQVELDSHAKRRANVAGAFGVADVEAIRGKTVVLVDDVSTSGATLTEAAKVLRAADCRTVWAIVIAKG